MNLTPVLSLSCDFGRGAAEWHIGVSLAAGSPDIKSVVTSQIASAAGRDIAAELTEPELDRIRQAIQPYLPPCLKTGD